MIIALLPSNKFRGGHNSQTGLDENWESSVKLCWFWYARLF